MSKPDDIPQDIWDAVLAEFDRPKPEGRLFSENYIEPYMRLIVAERERCAKVADHYTVARRVRQARELTIHEVYEVKIFARLIAAAIRNPKFPAGRASREASSSPASLDAPKPSNDDFRAVPVIGEVS